MLRFFFFMYKRPSATGIPKIVPVPVGGVLGVKKPFFLPVSPNIKLHKTISINAVKSRCFFFIIAYFHKTRGNNTNKRASKTEGK